MSLEFVLPQNTEELGDAPWVFMAMWPLHPVVIPCHGITTDEDSVAPVDEVGNQIGIFSKDLAWMVVAPESFADRYEPRPFDIIDPDGEF